MSSVLITGCSKGIGFEAALAFARAGHQVYATMRNPSQSPALADTAAREKLPITIATMDVDSDESVSNAIAAIQKNGPIDVLVNNAGIEGVGPVEELPLAKFRSIMETNYFGTLRCIQAVVPEMRQRKSGCIINISSVAGRICNPPLTSYCASKWALEALSEGLAGELKTFNVRVAIVEPGIIDTAMAQRIGDPAPGSPYAQTESWQLRHPVGPDAAGFLEWRKSMSDEEWIEMNAGDDATFFAKLGGSE
jgi:NAD(P)-dependent dehydrogenase (short-subunit alcohol dehydrogenase family)